MDLICDFLSKFSSLGEIVFIFIAVTVYHIPPKSLILSQDCN